MIDASKLPSTPAASDPARNGKPPEPESTPEFVRAPDGAGYVRGQAQNTSRGA